MNADDLKKRTKQFALRILKLVAALPNNVQGRAIGGQLVRSGTSVGSNIEPRAEEDLKLSSSQNSASLKKKQMRVLTGWS